MTADNMTTEGLYDAAFGSSAVLRDSDSFEERQEARRWLLVYLKELKRRAMIADRPAFLSKPAIGPGRV